MVSLILMSCPLPTTEAKSTDTNPIFGEHRLLPVRQPILQNVIPSLFELYRTARMSNLVRIAEISRINDQTTADSIQSVPQACTPLNLFEKTHLPHVLFSQPSMRATWDINCMAKNILMGLAAQPSSSKSSIGSNMSSGSVKSKSIIEKRLAQGIMERGLPKSPNSEHVSTSSFTTNTPNQHIIKMLSNTLTTLELPRVLASKTGSTSISTFMPPCKTCATLSYPTTPIDVISEMPPAITPVIVHRKADMRKQSDCQAEFSSSKKTDKKVMVAKDTDKTTSSSNKVIIGGKTTPQILNSSVSSVKLTPSDQQSTVESQIFTESSTSMHFVPMIVGIAENSLKQAKSHEHLSFVSKLKRPITNIQQESHEKAYEDAKTTLEPPIKIPKNNIIVATSKEPQFNCINSVAKSQPENFEPFSAASPISSIVTFCAVPTMSSPISSISATEATISPEISSPILSVTATETTESSAISSPSSLVTSSLRHRGSASDENGEQEERQGGFRWFPSTSIVEGKNFLVRNGWHEDMLFPVIIKAEKKGKRIKIKRPGQVSKEYIYVLEKFDHLSLAQIMEKNGAPFEESMASEIFAQIVDGIHHLHTCNFKHRELSLHAIWLNKNNLVKITQLTSANNEMKVLKYSKCPFPEFLAPEVLKGGYYMEPADMWSLGVILFKMLTNQMPFFGSDLESLLNSIQRGLMIPQGLSQLASDLVDLLISEDMSARPLAHELRAQCEWLAEHKKYFAKATATSSRTATITNNVIIDRVARIFGYEPRRVEEAVKRSTYNPLHATYLAYQFAEELGQQEDNT